MYEKILEFLTSNGYIGVIIGGLAEALFMPFPMEVIYIPVALSRPSRAIYYAVFLIVSSILGSLISYVVGKVGGEKLLFKIPIIKRNFHKIQSLYDKNSFITIMTSAFTPLPYEVYTLTAGIFKINFKNFILASVISRFIRYIPQAIIIFLFGDRFLSSIKRYGLLSAVALFLIFISIKLGKHVYQLRKIV